jgi:hypothetical protein
MRQPDTARFEARDGETAIFVLTPWVDSRGRQPRPDLYMPAGFAGARIPLPLEGGEALLAAVREAWASPTLSAVWCFVPHPGGDWFVPRIPADAYGETEAGALIAALEAAAARRGGQP